MPSVSDTAPVIWEPDKLLALALSRPSEALAAAREVLARNPPASQAAVAHQAAGVVLRHFGDIGEAIEEFKNARRFARKAGDLDRDPMSRPAWAPPWFSPGRRGAACPFWTPCWQRSRGVPRADPDPQGRRLYDPWPQRRGPAGRHRPPSTC